MDSSFSKNQYSIIPSNESRCIWMGAGILSYKLCDREFNCEQCPLDAAIRNREQNSLLNGSKDVFSQLKTASDKRFDINYRYSKNHCWCEILDDKTVRIGIEPFLANILTTPKDIIFLSDGQSLKINHPCLWIITEGGTLSIPSPVDGTISEVNSALVSKPNTICEHPLESGWLYELQTDVNIIRGVEFMDYKYAATQYSQDQKQFEHLLASALQQNNPSIGLTLADGGQPLESISEALGFKRYFLILQQAFGLKISQRKKG
jgi:glycine cleavage system H protein